MDCDLVIHVVNDTIGKFSSCENLRHFLGVHKAILAARCRFFEGMFRGGFQEMTQKSIHHDTKIPFTSFTALIRYFYTGIDCPL
jgi:hypothetical protein